MTTGLSSDEVAEDYKNCLEDLQLNSRYEISNLTVIAKESIDHALAISRVIETHIRTTPPNRKLLGLYVLDSVVKNVGTPYTLFFQRNLYQTFMNAYTLVDGPIRKKLEEMLKTWKEPVPGSLDSRPVFPVEVTRSIENALIKARTAAVQLHQQQARNLQGRVPGTVRGTSTPPPGTPGLRFSGPPNIQHPGYPQQHQQGYMQRQISNPLTSPELVPGLVIPRNQSPAIQHSQYLPPAPTPSLFPPTGGYTHSAGSLETLNSDLSNLISIARAEFAANPYDQGLQQRLKALLDLQTILQNQHLPPDQIKLIRDQVAQLTPETQPTVSAVPTTTYSISPVAAAPPPPAHEPVSQIQPSVQSLLPPNALAALLASATAGQAQNSPTPQPVPAIPVSQPYMMLSPAPPTPALGPVPVVAAVPVSAPTPTPVSTQQPADGNSLLASLRAAGILPPVTSTPPNAPSVPPTTFGSSLLPKSETPKPQSGKQTGRLILADVPRTLQLTSAALKTPHPHLIFYLYEAQPNQCRTCGRRFPANEEGKKRKARHLDWHFKVNIRMGEAAKRGQNRSWYVDEMEWIKSRDDTDEGDHVENMNVSTTLTAENDGDASSTKTKNAKGAQRQPWIPVPNDPAMANTTCPICQEKFETVWHDEAQEWVWMDAVKIGGRIYHASCHAEASRDGGSGNVNNGASSSSRNRTPDSALLGKRKADDSDMSQNPARNKLKKEYLP